MEISVWVSGLSSVCVGLWTSARAFPLITTSNVRNGSCHVFLVIYGSGLESAFLPPTVQGVA